MKKKIKFDDEDIPEVDLEKSQYVEPEKKKEDKTEKKAKSDDLRTMFNEDREYWTAQVKQHSNDFRDFKKLVDLEANLFFDRQLLVESRHKLMTKLSKLNTNLTIKKKDRHIYYKTDYSLKLTTTEKDIAVDADLGEFTILVDLLDIHVQFLEQTIKTMDNIIYGVKYRITLEENKHI